MLTSKARPKRGGGSDRIHALGSEFQHNMKTVEFFKRRGNERLFDQNASVPNPPLQLNSTKRFIM